jgi:hypothetical protein
MDVVMVACLVKICKIFSKVNCNPNPHYVVVSLFSTKVYKKITLIYECIIASMYHAGWSPRTECYV